MARRLSRSRPRRPSGRSARPPGSGPSRTRAGSGSAPPRRGLQLLVWALALTVFCGLALLSGQTFGFGSGAGSGAGGTVSAAPVSTTAVPTAVQDTEGQVVAGPDDRPLILDHDSDGGASPEEESECTDYNEQSDFLPLNRWSSFSLHTVDNAWLLKTRLITSIFASFFFMVAALAWRIIGMLMGFSYTFDMVCRSADSINEISGTMARYASWFLIPAWLVVLAAAIKRWSTGGRKGPASAVRLVMVFLSATGLIFFIADQSEERRNDPTKAYTVPWMAATVQGWFAEVSDALAEMTNSQGESSGEVFYDDDPAASGRITCDGLHEKLYELYGDENGGFPGNAAMQQISRMWESSLVRSWMVAQLSDGTEEYPAPAHAACRVLEANSDVDIGNKLKAFDLSAGWAEGTTTTDIWRGFYLSPRVGEQTIMVAWGACKMDADDEGRVHTTPQWDAADVDGKENGCKQLYSDGETMEDTDSFAFLLAGMGPLKPFYFNGGDELSANLGKCVTDESDPSCRYIWDSAEAWLGANQTERLTQGLMSMIVAGAFLFALGPMAIGLTMISVALAGLAMILPLSLLFFAMGWDSGKRLLKLTGAAAAGKFVFTLALTALATLIDATYIAITDAVGTAAPNFFEQVAQCAAPLVALWLFKKITKFMGLGNIGSMTGALGFAGAAALKSTGDNHLLRPGDDAYARQLSGALGQVGMGRARLSALDERSLQNRMFNNRGTRAAGRAGRRLAGRAAVGTGRAIGRGAERATRPIRNSAAAAIRRRRNDLADLAGSGTPAERAAKYAELTAALAAGTAIVSPALLPLVGAAMGGVALYRGAHAARDGLRNAIHLADRVKNGVSLDGALKPGEVAGMPMAGNPEAAKRRADARLRNIDRINNVDEQRQMMKEHISHELDMVRAKMYGGGHIDGLNLDFKGFVNDQEKMRALLQLSKKTGLAPDQIMLADNGLWLPQGDAAERHWSSHLDDHTKRRRIVDGVEETDTQLVTRIMTQGIARGYVIDGEHIDVPAERGFEELSGIKIRARGSEEAALRAGRDWEHEQGPSLGQRRLREAADVADALEDAGGWIRGGLMSKEVELPDGVTVRVGQVKADLDLNLTRMGKLAEQMAVLHEQRHAMDPDYYRFTHDQQMRQRDDYAGKIEELSTTLRDVVDASMSARSATGLRTEMVDPDISMDTSGVMAQAQKISEELNAMRKTWHQQVDKHAGSVYRLPMDQADATEFVQALEKFGKVLASRLLSEEESNREVADRLRKLEQRLQHSQSVYDADPRNQAAPPDNGRDLVAWAVRR
ncbi:hypothetical protein [Actinomadura sp. HBU206391]|uniref:hypothetical protein n=1 Tax=Actinomadura sp. HBU206391 TaxID=2731692 RepID=UPI00164FC826|nr:hypothetical protein [Actinomadura sp. HBU206391]MBC6458080.1 hypothetical protein [Actinomadura sp. HBU206391]